MEVARGKSTFGKEEGLRGAAHMSSRWSVFDRGYDAELESQLTGKERALLPHRTREHMDFVRSPRALARITLLLLVTVLWVGLLLGLGVLLSRYTNRPLYAVFLPMISLGAILTTHLLWRTTRQHAKRKALRSFGYDVCVNCGYWLRGLDASVPRCPECGAQRER